MVDIPFVNFAFLPTGGATTPRTMPTRLGEVINVKDFGALGNNVDDTAAVQAAFDAAFGPIEAPHGTNAILNRPVYFPAGNYNCPTPASKICAISAITNSGVSNAIRLTVPSNSLATGDIVNVYGMTGSTELNKSSWGIIKEDATHIRLIGTNFAWFAGTPSGGTVVGPGLFLRSVLGPYIYGDSRQSSNIGTSTPGGSGITTNGCGYGVIDRLNFGADTSNGGIGFNYDWDGSGPQSSQAMTFRDCSFLGDYGLSIGSSGQMCSETNITNCHFFGASKGLYVRNFNALQQTVIGGNFQNCATAIHVASGSVPIIHGVGFQQQSAWDIRLENTVGDGCSIHGCRSEGSANFLMLQSGNDAHVANCTHQGPVGVFCSVEGGSGVYPGSICMDNNYSANGTVGGNGEYHMRGNLFANANPLSALNTSTAIVHSYDNVGKNPCTVANLPTAAACFRNCRMTVTNSSVAGSGNFGAIVAGGGSNVVPVYCDGTNWRIG